MQVNNLHNKIVRRFFAKKMKLYMKIVKKSICDDGCGNVTNSNDMEDINNFIKLKKLQNTILKKIIENISKSKKNIYKN